jgi:hypothetical protein
MKRLGFALLAVAALALPVSTATAGPHGHHGHYGPRHRAYYGSRHYRPDPWRNYRRWPASYTPVRRYYRGVPFYAPGLYPAYGGGFSYSSPGFSFYFGM